MANGIKFRPLEADEIEVRVAQAKENGVSLLLYKDARCDMRMLDEAVGAENWECDYQEIHNALYCTVRIFDSERGAWVAKQDCGVPSNMEGLKGESSDAFKRACFKWGIGRELYTAPFIWAGAGNCTIKQGKNGNPACYDRFSVKSITTEDGRIRSLTIWNDTLRKVAWSNEGQAPSGSNGHDAKPTEPCASMDAKQALWNACKAYADAHGTEAKAVSEGIKKRPDYEESDEYFYAVADELNQASNE